MDIHQFFLGNAFDAYTFFGAQVLKDGGVRFCTLAPNAEKISLICEVNGWQEIPMEKIHDGGIFACTVADAVPGMMYKYRIYPQNPEAEVIDHCDPYGFGMQLRPNSASIIRDNASYHFQDDSWMQWRGGHLERPVNIYEVHFGSWKTNPNDPNGWYRYEELAPKLIAYAKKNGYNYIECMPLSEHPADCSWGYQNTGFFSPTARYGDMDGLKKFVDLCHRNEIGVIMDFVPVHFAVDGYGLARYDGTTLYEYPEDSDTYSEWGSCNFIHARGEVCSFLQSCANYWIQEFHFDGIRMDAVSRLIYWGGDPNRGENPASLTFLKRMNQGLHQLHPDAMLIAEDSTNFEGVTRPVAFGGLGFDYKWDMGWMNDTLNYFRCNPFFRGTAYHQLTFSMMYYYNERYLLPFSHDETVHGKASIVQKMHGDYEQKFPQARALYLYMYTHPGKKLNFMGNELGQLREWTEEQEQDWGITSYPIHDAFHHFMQDLNQIYLREAALSKWDYRREGFCWVDCHQEERCIYAYERRAEQERLLVVLYFSDVPDQEYTITIPNCDALEPLLHSDWTCYGGTVEKDDALLPAEATEKGGQITLPLAPYSGMLFRIHMPTRKK
jgi:1,4-alpha-glucan branching enzyme